MEHHLKMGPSPLRHDDFDFGRITMFGETWSHEVTMFVGQIVMAIVFWTGILKWHLPRIKKWSRKRKLNTNS